MRDRIVRINDRLIVVDGRVVEIEPGSLDIGDAGDAVFLRGFVFELWTAPGWADQLKFGNETYHKLFFFDGDRRNGIHVVPGHLASFDDGVLAEILAAIERMAEEAEA